MLSDPFIDGSDAGSESYAGSYISDEQCDEDLDQGNFGTDDDIEAEQALTAAEKRFAGEVCFSPSTCPLLNLTACPAGDLVG